LRRVLEGAATSLSGATGGSWAGDIEIGRRRYGAANRTVRAGCRRSFAMITDRRRGAPRLQAFLESNEGGERPTDTR
jgi:hypothetical protein